MQSLDDILNQIITLTAQGKEILSQNTDFNYFDYMFFAQVHKQALNIRNRQLMAAKED